MTNKNPKPQSAQQEMESLVESLRALQQEFNLRTSHLDNVADEDDAAWDTVDPQGDVANLLQVMESTNFALDEMERRADSLTAKIQALLEESDPNESKEATEKK